MPELITPETTIDHIRLQVKDSPKLLRFQEKDLLRRYKLGDKLALERLTHACYPLVWGVVSLYKDKEVCLEDLFQAGATGIQKVITKWDAEQTKLSTYAYKTIHREVKRQFESDSQAIRLPREIAAGQATLRNINQEGLTDQQVAYEADMSIELLREHRIWDQQTPTVALDDFIDEDEDVTVAESIGNWEDDPQAIALSGFDSLEKKQLVQEWLEALPDRENKVVRWLGNYDDEYTRPYTQAEVAKKLGINQYEVSRINKRAEAKIRKMNRV